ncbi:MAG: glycosyltransferase family 87 protein [Candidatus Sulfotelmatobacter sp.]
MGADEKQFASKSGARFWRLGLIFVAGSLWLNLLIFIDFGEGIKRGYPDFTVLYTAGTILREGRGHELYNSRVQYQVQQDFSGHIAFRGGALPYIHPPFEAPLFVPLTWLPYTRAFAVWDLLNVAMLFGVGLLLRQSVACLRSVQPWKFALGSLTFFPVFACLLEGQDSILMLLLCALAFNALKRKADFLAGCWLALAAFKFQFIVPIVLLLVLWKRRRAAIGFGAVATVLALLSVSLVGVKALLQYPGYVRQVVASPSLGGVPPELLPNLHGLAMGWHGPFSGTFGVALAVLSSMLLIVFAVQKGLESAHQEKLELLFSLAIVVSVLVAWQTNSHDLSLLVIPLVLVTDYSLHLRTQKRAVRFALLFPVLPLLLGPLWLVLWLVSAKVNLIAILLLYWAWMIGKEIPRDRGSADFGLPQPHWVGVSE